MITFTYTIQTLTNIRCLAGPFLRICPWGGGGGQSTKRDHTIVCNSRGVWGDSPPENFCIFPNPILYFSKFSRPYPLFPWFGICYPLGNFLNLMYSQHMFCIFEKTLNHLKIQDINISIHKANFSY